MDSKKEAVTAAAAAAAAVEEEGGESEAASPPALVVHVARLLSFVRPYAHVLGSPKRQSDCLADHRPLLSGCRDR